MRLWGRLLCVSRAIVWHVTGESCKSCGGGCGAAIPRPWSYRCREDCVAPPPTHPHNRRDSMNLPHVSASDELFRMLFRSSLTHFPPRDQQHAIQFDALINLLNLLAATSTGPTATMVAQRTVVVADDMDDDELFFHILQQELTNVNHHFEESAGVILAQWAAHTQDTSDRGWSLSSRDSQDWCSQEVDLLAHSFDSSKSGTSSSEDNCCFQKTRQSWTIAQAAKWCWQFARINALAAQCLVNKRDSIRRDGAGALFLDTQARQCRFMQSPLLLELQAISALQHVNNSGMFCSLPHVPCQRRIRFATETHFVEQRTSHHTRLVLYIYIFLGNSRATLPLSASCCSYCNVSAPFCVHRCQSLSPKQPLRRQHYEQPEPSHPCSA